MDFISHDVTDYEHLLFEVDDEHVCWLTLNRPEEMNSFNERLLAELKAALLRADFDDNVHVIVIRGSGRGFCAGADLYEDAEDDRTSVYGYRMKYFRMFDQFTTPWTISKPVIASVHKFAIGKGFELALFCDITIASSDTKIGYNEVRYGISGHCMFMPWLVNMKSAKDLLLTARDVTADEAKSMGLITEVVAPEDLHEITRKRATLMARMPSGMQRMHKMYLNRVYEMQGLKGATDYYIELMSMLGVEPMPEYAEFTKMTVEKGLRAALDHAQARYIGLE